MRGCAHGHGRISPGQGEELLMGGKPSKGTKRDKRLSSNKRKSSKKGKK
jgi:hypothetical protein